MQNRPSNIPENIPGPLYTPAQWDQLDADQEARVARTIRERRWSWAAWEYGCLEWIRYERGQDDPLLEPPW